MDEDKGDQIQDELSSIGSEEYTSGDDDDEENETKSKAVDGGWGWVVVFASFVISMAADGISFSFGLLYVQFLDYFKASKSATSWIGSLFMAVPLLSGPVASALVDRFGCRSMTIIGACLSCFGFAISSVVDSMVALYITFGIIAGLGLGLCYVTAVVSVAYWFDKKRSLATSLGACGTGIGTFAYAPLTQFLINEFGWRGTVLLLGGTLLNMSVCGALMRDPPLSETMSKSARESSSGLPSTIVGDLPPIPEETQRSPQYIMTATSIPRQGSLEHKPNSFQSVVNLPTFINHHEKVPVEVLQALGNNKRVFDVVLDNYPSLLHCRSVSNELIHEQSLPKIPVTLTVKEDVSPPEHLHSGPQPVHSPIDRSFWLKKLKNSNYLSHIRVHRSSLMYRGAMLNILKYRLRASSCPDIYRNSITTIAKESNQSWYQELLNILSDVSDFKMFLELHFFLVSVGTTIVFIWFIVPYFYLAEHMSRHGYSEDDASFVLSVIGITNTIGMVFFGWAGDREWLNVAKTYAVCLVLTGLFTGAIPLVTHNFTLLLQVCAAFGAFFASSYSFTPPLLVELVPLERFTTAYGLSLLCQGIGNLLGPPLAGLIFDLTESWDYSFYLAGLWIIIAGVFIGLVPMFKNRRMCGSGPIGKEHYGVQ